MLLAAARLLAAAAGCEDASRASCKSMKDDASISATLRRTKSHLHIKRLYGCVAMHFPFFFIISCIKSCFSSLLGHLTFYAILLLRAQLNEVTFPQSVEFMSRIPRKYLESEGPSETAIMKSLQCHSLLLMDVNAVQFGQNCHYCSIQANLIRNNYYFSW